MTINLCNFTWKNTNVSSILKRILGELKMSRLHLKPKTYNILFLFTVKIFYPVRDWKERREEKVGGAEDFALKLSFFFLLVVET